MTKGSTAGHGGRQLWAESDVGPERSFCCQNAFLVLMDSDIRVALFWFVCGKRSCVRFEEFLMLLTFSSLTVYQM